MIYYISKAKKNPFNKTVFYYAQMTNVVPENLDTITKRITSTCTVTEHDVKAVLSALQEQVTNALMDGKSVRLGALGSFRPTLSSTPEATADEVGIGNIKSVHVRYTPSARLRTFFALKENLRFAKAETVE